MTRTIAKRGGRTAIGMRAQGPGYEGFHHGPGRGAVEVFQETRARRPAGCVRRAVRGDEQGRRGAIDLRVVVTGWRTIMFNREPAEPRQVRMPVDTSQRRDDLALIGSDPVIVTIAGAMMFVMMAVARSMQIRIVARLRPAMPVRIAAIRVRVAQLEPGQAAENDQSGKQDMQSLMTQTGHDGIRNAPLRECPKNLISSYHDDLGRSSPRDSVRPPHVSPGVRQRILAVSWVRPNTGPNGCCTSGNTIPPSG